MVEFTPGSIVTPINAERGRYKYIGSTQHDGKFRAVYTSLVSDFVFIMKHEQFVKYFRVVSDEG